VSAKKHILVPRNFTEADAPRAFSSDKFHRMSATEMRELCAAGRIHALGGSGKVWQLTEDSFTHADRETGDGRISLHIPVKLGAFMATEMRRRPSWCVTI
jgi:hypothetical protein